MEMMGKKGRKLCMSREHRGWKGWKLERMEYRLDIRIWTCRLRVIRKSLEGRNSTGKRDTDGRRRLRTVSVGRQSKPTNTQKDSKRRAASLPSFLNSSFSIKSQRD